MLPFHNSTTKTMITIPLESLRLIPTRIEFIPDYPHSVLKVTLPKIGNCTPEFPNFVRGQLRKFCLKNGICVSVLPQFPTYVLRIEGMLIATEGRGFIIGNRCISYRDQQTIDLGLLIEALRAISPCFNARIETRAGEFPENRDPSFVKGFVCGFRINQAQQVAYNRANPAERFREPHQDPENPEFY